MGLLGTFLKEHVHKNSAILNTGYDVALHDKYGNTYSQWTVGFILYCHIILLYNYNIH